MGEHCLTGYGFWIYSPITRLQEQQYPIAELCQGFSTGIIHLKI